MTPTEQALENLRRDVRHNNATEFNANERNSYQHGFDVGYNRCLDDVKNQALTASAEKDRVMKLMAEALTEAKGCFDAANCEGLTQKLLDAADSYYKEDTETGSLFDLVNRRLLQAYTPLENALVEYAKVEGV